MWHDSREFKLRVQRQTTNVRQRKILSYKAIKNKWACCFITRMYKLFLCHMKENMTHRNRTKKLCQENSALPFAVPANVKLKLLSVYPNFNKAKKQCQLVIAFINQSENGPVDRAQISSKLLSST